jgi:16S rRNA (guanine527-N7)-methyltransferase
METSRIAALLQTFTAGAELSPAVLHQIQLYLDLLLRWNRRVNLTSVRDPEQIVTRHFGESLFAAQVLAKNSKTATSLADVGSGAGFPGIPIKLWVPQLRLTLIESQNKKATFLREVLRSINLPNAEVFCGRAEQWKQAADIVTLRAVERFESALPMAASLVTAHGRLCLLIGSDQFDSARKLLPEWSWAEQVPIPGSNARVIALGQR